MRRIRYLVAMSTDGCIAGPNGETDWIGIDPEIDFSAIWAQFDTLLMGRKTYEAGTRRLGRNAFAGMNVIVFSRTMQGAEHPGITVASECNPERIESLKNQNGKDLWLMGGASLFRVFLDLGLVDTVEVTVIPVLLGEGVPLLPPPFKPTTLKLSESKIYRSGRVGLSYDVQR